MPKLRGSPEQLEKNAWLKLVNGNLAGQGMKYYKQLAEKTGIKESTMDNRVNNPDMFRLHELRRVAISLKMTPLEVGEAVLGVLHKKAP